MATGRRARLVEIQGPSTTQLVYAPDGFKFAYMNGQTVQKYIAPLTAGVQAVYTAKTPAAVNYWRHADWLGSSRLASTMSRTVYYDGAYAPFGENYVETGTTDRRFTGQTPDMASASGLYDFTFRQQSSAQGRWLVPDPAGMAAVDITNPQTWNRYAYVANDPMNAVDPLGLHRNCVNLILTACSGWETDQSGNSTGGGNPNWNEYFNLSGMVGDNSGPDGQWITGLLPGWSIWSTIYLNEGGGGGGAGDSKPPCSASSGGTKTIVNTSYTFSLSAPAAFIGGAIGGPPGAFAGGVIGSMLGLGGSTSYVPSTKSLYAGAIVVAGLGIGAGQGWNVSTLLVPASQNPNSIASGLTFSVTYQPTAATGSTVTKSPGSGPAVAGPSIGTRIPFAGSASYSFCLFHCGC